MASRSRTGNSIGVDFGTTNSKIGICEDEQVTLLRHGASRDDYIPTAIAYRQEQDQAGVVIGSKARVRFKNDPSLPFGENFKMLLPMASPEEWQRNGWRLERTPAQTAQEYFRQLLFEDPDSVVRQYGSIGKVVFSVPEVWHRRQGRGVEVLRGVLTDLGLEDFQLQSEPVCAAAHYVRQTVENHPDGEYDLLVCDVGGGTFDVAFCHVWDNRVVEVIDFDGNGEDGFGEAGVAFDRQVVRTSLANSEQAGLTPSDHDFIQLMHAFEEVKITNQADAERLLLDIGSGGGLGGDEFALYHFSGREVTGRQVRECFDFVREGIVKVLKGLDESHGLSDRRFELAIVGGFGRFPLVQRSILDYFGIDPSGSDPRYDRTTNDWAEFRLHAVAKGAAQLACDLVKAIVPFAHTIGMMVHRIKHGRLVEEFLPIVRAGEVVAGELDSGRPKITYASERGRPMQVEVMARRHAQLPVRVQFKGVGELFTPPLPEDDYPEPGIYHVGVSIDRSNLGALVFNPAGATSGLRRQEHRLGNLDWPIFVGAGRMQP